MKTVIEMAREAGEVLNKEWLERFAELVRADERARMVEQPAQSTADKSELETVPAKGGLLPAQQEPVAWVCYGSNNKHDIDFFEDEIADLAVGTMLYTSPPTLSLAQRQAQSADTWVGLSHEEIDYQAKKDDHAIYFALGALWAEAKLKEKNGG